MRKMKKIFCIVVGITLLVSGCVSNRPAPSEINPNEIVEAMCSMKLRWKNGGLPENEWPDIIRNLNPMQVYSDRVNSVIVLSKEGEIERGYYVHIPISSYLPANGAGWAFERIGENIWQYTRIRGGQ
jgi:hypothetical protein